MPNLLAGALSALGAGLVYGLGFHIPRLPTIPETAPAESWNEAAIRLARWDEAEANPILPICHSRILGADGGTRSVVMLLHGYTNCPQQFHLLASQLVKDGHTVLVPRLPYHGQTDRCPKNLGEMTPARLAMFLGEMLGIAHGLGERITVLGFSFGGVLAAWLAQQRADVEHAILASASLGLSGIPPWLRRPMTNVTRLAPDFQRWWDPERREAKLGPPYMYVVYSMRGVGMMLGLGNGLLAAAKRRTPAAARITVALNPSDTIVDNEATQSLVHLWRTLGAAVNLYEFSPEMDLYHDYMDPLQPRQQIELVYPILRGLVAERPIQ